MTLHVRHFEYRTHFPPPALDVVSLCLLFAFFRGFPQRSEALATTVEVTGGAKKPAEPQGWRALIPTKSERKKLLPLAGMFFCILFNYTILRDTKVCCVFFLCVGVGAFFVCFLRAVPACGSAVLPRVQHVVRGKRRRKPYRRPKCDREIDAQKWG